ncbi:exopolysaccharide biosynthesis polyprenyl glycosylphosphotransferase [Caulobacter henricii]|uniref:polysaccharide biosynthesis protein HfsE n=1 Tax=Caulobacter henricii TaxID=69395 RepID=UPI000A014947|nr:exopolysaccharide biosynthesis polyprenyl glycosylphosphotransferase [Caulobacter henricii]
MPHVISRDLPVPSDAASDGAPKVDVVPTPPRSRTSRHSPSSARRGPFRPEHLVPARARFEARALARAFRAVDALIAAGYCAAMFAIMSQRPGDPLIPGHAILSLGGGLLVLLLSLRALDAYVFARREPLPRHALRVAAAFGAGATTVLAVNTALPAWNAPTVFPVVAFMGLAPLVLVLHTGWWIIIGRGRRHGRLTPNIVVVGATANAQHLIEAALRTGEVNVLGIFDDRLDRAPENLLGVPVLGDTSALIDHRVMPYVDRIVITVTPAAQSRVRQLVEKLEVLPNPISLFVDVGRDQASDAAVSRIADAALTDLSGNLGSTRKAILKRLQDLVVGIGGLIVAAPIMAIVAIAVRLDSPGPVFFRQRRHGFNNEEILVWKFRSMRHDMADARAVRQISANDDRVTKVGRFIRKTSLDELPQLFNVLAGEMSIVGPRPHAVGMKTGDVESAKLVEQYAHRHRMKPGVTGWAAINGSRGPVDTPELVRERVALDVDYIERQSFWLDLYIIIMTIPCLLGDRATVR